MASETRQFSEATFGDPSRAMRVDREAQIIRGVKCLGRESKNGRIYSDQALEDARGFYEGIDVNLDHPPDGASAERRMVDGFGVLRNARTINEGVFADLHYLAAHPMAEVIAERAEKFPGNFGMSHNATGRVREDPNSDKLIVEGLERVESVDIVRRPATNKGLFESESTDRSEHAMTKAKDEKKTVRQVLEANPKDKRAASLLLLLEGEDFKAAGDIELDSGATTKDALRKLVAESFDDKAVDIETTIERVGKLLEREADPPPDKSKTEASTLESLAKRLDALTRHEAIRDLLEEKGLQRSDLTAPQRKVLARAESVEAAEDLLESWNVRPASGRQRPAIGSARLSDPDDESKSYDDLRESVFPKAG